MINNNTKRIIFILTIISIYNTMTKVKRNDNIEYIYIYIYIYVYIYVYIMSNVNLSQYTLPLKEYPANCMQSNYYL